MALVILTLHSPPEMPSHWCDKPGPLPFAIPPKEGMRPFSLLLVRERIFLLPFSTQRVYSLTFPTPEFGSDLLREKGLSHPHRAHRIEPTGSNMPPLWAVESYRLLYLLQWQIQCSKLPLLNFLSLSDQFIRLVVHARKSAFHRRHFHHSFRALRNRDSAYKRSAEPLKESSFVPTWSKHRTSPYNLPVASPSHGKSLTCFRFSWLCALP